MWNEAYRDLYIFYISVIKNSYYFIIIFKNII